MRKLYLDLQSIAMVSKRGTRISQSEWKSFTTNMKELCRQVMASEEITECLEKTDVSHAVVNVSDCFTPSKDDEVEIVPHIQDVKRKSSLDVCTPVNQQILNVKTPTAPKRIKLDPRSLECSSDLYEEVCSERAKACHEETRCENYNIVRNDCFHLGQLGYLRCSLCNPRDCNNW